MSVDSIEPIGFDVPKQDVYPTFTERYFQPKYLIDAAHKESEDHCVLVHSNRICVITLAPSHPVIALKKPISNLNFKIAENTDRSKNTVQGKRKHGAQCLQPMSVLGVIECEDGSKFSVRSCVYGKLIEINEKLSQSPQLLQEKPNSDGYIAIVLPHITLNAKYENELLQEEDYCKAVSERKEREANDCDSGDNVIAVN